MQALLRPLVAQPSMLDLRHTDARWVIVGGSSGGQPTGRATAGVTELAPGRHAALLSANVSPSAVCGFTDAGWQIEFHHGTPTPAR